MPRDWRRRNIYWRHDTLPQAGNWDPWARLCFMARLHEQTPRGRHGGHRVELISHRGPNEAIRRPSPEEISAAASASKGRRGHERTNGGAGPCNPFCMRRAEPGAFGIENPWPSGSVDLHGLERRGRGPIRGRDAGTLSRAWQGGLEIDCGKRGAAPEAGTIARCLRPRRRALPLWRPTRLPSARLGLQLWKDASDRRAPGIASRCVCQGASYSRRATTPRPLLTSPSRASQAASPGRWRRWRRPLAHRGRRGSAEAPQAPPLAFGGAVKRALRDVKHTHLR